MMLFILLTLLITAGTSIFLYIKRIDSYWDRRGVFTYRPKLKNENISFNAYKTLRAKGLKYGGYVRKFKPSFMVVDLDVIKTLLIKDADHFLNRGMYSDPKVDPMSATLTRLENGLWKTIRSTVSPIFSSGK